MTHAKGQLLRLSSRFGVNSRSIPIKYAVVVFHLRIVASNPATPITMKDTKYVPDSGSAELRQAEGQLDGARGQMTVVNESLSYLRQRQSQGLRGIVSVLGLSKTGSMINGYERDILSVGLQAELDKSKAVHGYEIQVLREVLNSDLENGKSVLRNKRGVLLTTQARQLIRDIVEQESAFEQEMTPRAGEIDAITVPLLKERARKSFEKQVDDFYRVTTTGVGRYTAILDEELK